MKAKFYHHKNNQIAEPEKFWHVYDLLDEAACRYLLECGWVARRREDGLLGHLFVSPDPDDHVLYTTAGALEKQLG